MPFEAGSKWSFSTGELAAGRARRLQFGACANEASFISSRCQTSSPRVEITKYALPGVKILAGTLSGLLQIGDATDPGCKTTCFSA